MWGGVWAPGPPRDPPGTPPKAAQAFQRLFQSRVIDSVPRAYNVHQDEHYCGK
jgi:hypothetical protein